MLADHFQIDQNDDFNLLFELGRECPGAVTIMPMDAPELTEGQVTPTFKVVDEKMLGRLLRDLPQRPLFVDTDGEVRMSLAGVQNKSAVLLTKDGIALPHGNTPTTHIVKIDITSLPESTKIENFCLRTAAGVGIKTVSSSIRQADGIDYLLVARYDRTVSGQEGSRFIRRLHQEDFCQALGRFPREKYEKDGGPGWKESFDLMKRMADPLGSRSELLSRAVFQFLIGNPDAHAKNYSLLYRPDGIHLSPFYDVNNAAAFKSHYKTQRTRLAMFVGGERDPELLTPDHWAKFADEIGMRPDTVFDRIYDLAAKIPATSNRIRSETVGTAAHSQLMDLAIEDITARCRRVLDWRTGPALRPEPELATAVPRPR
jgi:serine/threonine-protein kinase HipA